MKRSKSGAALGCILEKGLEAATRQSVKYKVVRGGQTATMAVKHTKRQPLCPSMEYADSGGGQALAKKLQAQNSAGCGTR